MITMVGTNRSSDMLSCKYYNIRKIKFDRGRDCEKS